MDTSNPSAFEAGPVFDPAMLLRNTNSNHALACKLVDLYLADLQVRTATLRQAIGAGDTGLVRLQAHALKGASLAVGALELARLTSSLEKAYWQGASSSVMAFMHELEALTLTTHEKIQAWKTNRPPQGTP